MIVSTRSIYGLIPVECILSYIGAFAFAVHRVERIVAGLERVRDVLLSQRRRLGQGESLT